MQLTSRAPKPKFAKPRANPTLETLEYIRMILVRADEPISRNKILLQLKKWGHSTTKPTLNAALRFMAADGSLVEGSKGIVWVPNASEALLGSIRAGESL